ncbi:MAG TPA: DinB family protein [Anaerolineales bacterium]|nr:DinB family protein [Anaerolineales bacterium]
MLTLLASYLDRLVMLHAEAERALDGLPPEALDWSPAPEINSLGVLAAHLAGAERYWIGDITGRDPSGRVREQEFQARGADAAALKQRLADVLAHSRDILERLTPEDLEVSHKFPSDGREFTVAWALAHALEHTAVHVGHMQITRQLWEKREK